MLICFVAVLVKLATLMSRLLLVVIVPELNISVFGEFMVIESLAKIVDEAARDAVLLLLLVLLPLRLVPRRLSLVDWLR